MNNEIKNRDSSDDEIEFEIPDISEISEELGISADLPDEAVQPTVTTAASDNPKADSEWSIPTEADHAKPKRKRKSAKKSTEISDKSDTDNEAAGIAIEEHVECPSEYDTPSDAGAEVDTPDSDSDCNPVINTEADESNADGNHDASSEPTEATEESSVSAEEGDEPGTDKLTDEASSANDGAAEPDSAATESVTSNESCSLDASTAASEIAEEKSEISESAEHPEADAEEVAEVIYTEYAEDARTAREISDEENSICSTASEASDGCIPANDAPAEECCATENNGDIVTLSESDAEHQETRNEEKFPDSLSDDVTVDESTDRKSEFMPREYKFPDDALSPVSSNHDESLIIDLLGDPLSDEPYVSHQMQPPPAPDASIEEYEDTNTVSKISEEKYDPEKPRRIDVVFDFIELVIFTLVAVLFVTTFFVKHAVVEGGSMYDTLYPNDILIISDLFYEPEYGDIIVAEDHTLEREDMRKPIVKRVIATEGQLVKVTRDTIYVNSVPLDEPYVFTDDLDYEYLLTPGESLRSIPGFFANDEHYTFVVPEGEVFVMGDHRNNSTDSRDVGTIRVDAILGRALFRIYPFARFGFIDD